MAKNESVDVCLAAVRENLIVINGCREEIARLLEEAGADELNTELQAAVANHEQLVEQLKQAARKSGTDRIALGEEGDIVISTTRPKVVEDPEAFLELAKRNGDLGALVAAGVVKTQIDAAQIERLDPRLRSRYAELVKTGTGTTRVLIPAALQAKALLAT